MDGYIFISNFSNTKAEKIWHAVTLQVAGITDFVVTDKAVDCLGRPLKNTLALYFRNTVSTYDTERYYQALHITAAQMRERGLAQW